MRILLVTHYFPEHGGGIEIVAQHIASGLQRRGFEIEWLASYERSLGDSAAPGANPVPAFNVSERLLGIPYPIWGSGAVLTIQKALRRCDVVHLHDALYMGNILTFIGAKQARKPVLVTQHVGHVPYQNPVLRGAMEVANRLVAARVISNATQTVFVSTNTERYFARLISPTARCTRIPNGLDNKLYVPLVQSERLAVRQELGWDKDRRVFLFVGRFVEKKGMPILRSLVNRFPEVLWVFVGWGPVNPIDWHFPNAIIAGRRSPEQIARMYQAADVLVLPSVGEGFPLVVQESMACGTPVAISAETAMAYPQLDRVAWTAEPTADAFESLLRRVLVHPEELQRRREASAAFAHGEWSWDRCVDEYAALLRRITPNQAPPD
jgi:glycosyltransferase involved in cell wall biosynthesis